MEVPALCRVLLVRTSPPPLHLHLHLRRCTASAAAPFRRRTAPPPLPASIPRRSASFLHRSPRERRLASSSPRLPRFTTRMLSTQNESTSTSPGVPVVTVEIAQELLNKGHHYLDVRTVEEFAAGHVQGAVNVPYMNRGSSGMVKNPSFLEDVRKKFNPDSEIVVGCQSGVRSKMATAELYSDGFTRLTDMSGGFGGWLRSGQPTTK